MSLQVLPVRRDKADPAAADLRGHVAQHLEQRGQRLRAARGVRRALAQPAGLALLEPVAPVAPVGAAPLEVGARARRRRPPRAPLAAAALLQLGGVHDALLEVLQREDDPLSEWSVGGGRGRPLKACGCDCLLHPNCTRLLSHAKFANERVDIMSFTALAWIATLIMLRTFIDMKYKVDVCYIYTRLLLRIIYSIIM